MTAARPIRVLIADDHPVVREGLRAVLGNRSDIEVIGDVADGAATIREAVLHRPDVVLLDLHMPGSDGLPAAPRLHGDTGAHHVRRRRACSRRCAPAPAVTYSRDAGQEEIVQALRAVHQGQAIFGAAVAGRITALLGNTGSSAPEFPELSGREREIVQLVGAGLGNAVIAHRLGLSIKTVANHPSAIYRKIQVPDRPHAIVKARAAHLGDDSQHPEKR